MSGLRATPLTLSLSKGRPESRPELVEWPVEGPELVVGPTPERLGAAGWSAGRA